MTVVNILLALLFGIIAFNFGAYTLLLNVVARFRKINHTVDPDFSPSVTVLIAAYNEGSVLKEKLENCLALDYPTELLNIIVVSDGSTDDTNVIAKQFEEHGITAILNQVNQGKATALNKGMEHITTDLVVLSDANVMYQNDAIRKLVRHFADPSIGAVSGKVVLLNEGLSYSDAENAYYSIEHKIQQLESNTGNLIGADGAMYALRRELFRPLQKDTLLDDFVLSMGAIQQGSRLIFDAEALGFEKNLAEMRSEYNRKVRIVAGGIQSLQRKTAWPPKGQPLTTTKFICHKVMRWIVGPVAVLFIALVLLRGAMTNNTAILFSTSIVVISYLSMLLLIRFFPSLLNFKAIGFCKYLLVMIKASLVGCYKGLARGQQVSWR